MGNKTSKQNYQRQTVLTVQTTTTRLRVAVGAIGNFFLYNFKGEDGFALATFNTHFSSAMSRSAVGNGEIDAERPLLELLNVRPSGGTRLYDSIKDAVIELESLGTIGRPWVLIVLTDGDDNHSSQYTAESIGSFVRQHFTAPYESHACPNYVFIVGVGPDLNPSKLYRMGASGNFRILHVQDFGLLQIQLAAIAYEITFGTSIAVNELRYQNTAAVWAELQDTINLREAPIDVMFLLDTSESMGWAA